MRPAGMRQERGSGLAQDGKRKWSAGNVDETLDGVAPSLQQVLRSQGYQWWSAPSRHAGGGTRPIFGGSKPQRRDLKNSLHDSCDSRSRAREKSTRSRSTSPHPPPASAAPNRHVDLTRLRRPAPMSDADDFLPCRTRVDALTQCTTCFPRLVNPDLSPLARTSIERPPAARRAFLGKEQGPPQHCRVFPTQVASPATTAQCPPPHRTSPRAPRFTPA
ncbi:hypothetical protein C8R47DRAFT_1081911 [Mycena vitilis]|nr:hypothetical protein C8R47DRAFT_1081911 [Mycena vitilis]